MIPHKAKLFPEFIEIYLGLFKYVIGDSLVAQMVKNPPVMREARVQSLSWEDLWRREWQPTPVFLLGKSHEQRGLAGNNPLGHKELDMT